MTDEIKGDKKEGVSILTHPLFCIFATTNVNIYQQTKVLHHSRKDLLVQTLKHDKTSAHRLSDWRNQISFFIGSTSPSGIKQGNEGCNDILCFSSYRTGLLVVYQLSLLTLLRTKVQHLNSFFNHL